MDENLTYAVCPNCGGELGDDFFFFEEVNVDSAYFSAVGYCLKCGKRYRWNETYSVFKNLQLYEIEEPEI